MLTLGCNSLHPHPIGMQLYLEGGAWFKKNTLGKNKFFGYQKERVVNVSRPHGQKMM